MNTAICPGCDAVVGCPDYTDLYDYADVWIGCDVCGKTATIRITLEPRGVARVSPATLSAGPVQVSPAT